MNQKHTLWQSLAMTVALAIGAANSFAATDSDLLKTPPHKGPPQQQVIRSGDVCFSPEGNCDRKLIEFIDSAKTTLRIAIYSLNHEGITTAILRAHDRGVDVRVVVDKGQSKSTNSGVPALTQDHVPTRFGNFSGIMQNKYNIVDDQMLETGSFNYSIAATSKNAENQIYLSTSTIVSKYMQNFETIWADARPTK